MDQGLVEGGGEGGRGGWTSEVQSRGDWEHAPLHKVLDFYLLIEYIWKHLRMFYDVDDY